MQKQGIVSNKSKVIDLLPEEFASYEEAADFWDRHDMMDYSDNFETVAAQVEFKQRRYEVEIDADLMPVLAEQAQRQGMAVGSLVSEWLREKVRPAA
jgi:predicted phosphatase